MKNAGKVFKEYLMIPVAMAAATAVFSIYYVSGEIGANAYTGLADAYTRANPDTKSAIQGAVVDGKISRWEYNELFRIVMDDVRGMAIKHDPGTVEQARDSLMTRLQGTASR
ncbi:hypothetical protein [Achromobacter sp. 2789STDY5608633]|uniref:hypothetical protein n=1 Tax=Achromobacter sp. 2789STDY5608633 TaxID=1806501 RepID=UPI000A92C435|nr:hypothetical protein [Achromobacter sp. 2789STDY5608633]